ncbi:MAG: hypothetical protein GDA43_04380 [Hormoscilla sp. SP5CHS1]|nr:hypothetical protein [Hormoscilla sp. SP5CHS1]
MKVASPVPKGRVERRLEARPRPARRFNPVIQAFCDRLLEKGKAKRAIRSNASIGQQGAGQDQE